jgi:hypothetical protein
VRRAANRQKLGGFVKLIATILTGLSFAVLFFVAPAHAQYDGQRTVANIPFEFTAGNISFPSGQYEFVRTGPNLVFVRNSAGRGLFVVASASIQPNWLPEKSMLKFATVDGRHVLIQIWNDLASIGNEFSQVGTSVDLANHPAIDGSPAGR